MLVYIATTLDGYIAGCDGNLDWLTEFPNPSGTDHGYNQLLDGVDTVVMGGRTYGAIVDMGVAWPYNQQKTYVVCRNAMQPNKQVTFITSDVVEKIAALKNEPGKNIWLVGGGELIGWLLGADLIDELQICYVPVILGAGIPLFPNIPKPSHWQFVLSTTYDSGIVKLDFAKR